MEEYSNKDLVIPFYTEEEIMEGNITQFPFNDKYMTYDKRKHQYMLTEDALVENGITLDDNQPDAKKIFLEQVSRAVYSQIKVKAGVTNYAKMMYRIAKGYGAQNLSQLDFRTIFMDEVLLVQAKYMAEGGYAKDMPKVVLNPDTGRVKASDMSNVDGYWLHDDVITTLDALNLTKPQRIVWSSDIHWDEY